MSEDKQKPESTEPQQDENQTDGSTERKLDLEELEDVTGGTGSPIVPRDRRDAGH